MKNFFQTEAWKWIRVLIEIALLAAVLVLLGRGIMSLARADPITEEVWILCEPTGTVNIRSRPGGPVFGGCGCGAVMWTDNRQKDGFLHVLDLAAEEDTGWVSARYVVYDEPREVNAEMTIQADGRVACRKWIGGKIIRWMKPGDTVTVYWMSDEWAVTNRGYIMSAFLGGDG